MTRIGLVCFGCLLFSGLVLAKDDVPANLIAGKQVEPNAKIQVGQKLVAYYENKAYLVEIKKVNPNRTLLITWVESKEDADDVKPEELYYFGNSAQTRKSKADLLPEAFRAFDKNKDGQIGLYEWDRSKLAEFRKLDKNRDGFLTPQELGKKAVAVAAPAAAKSETAATTTPSTKEDDSKPIPAPTNLIDYQDKAGDAFVFSVTGKADGGTVWGDGNYSIDSSLAAAVVHSGVLKNGVTGVVSVKIFASADKFAGKAANGVTSLERNESGPAFTVSLKP